MQMGFPKKAVAFKIVLVLSSLVLFRCTLGQHHGHGDIQPVPFAYCKPYLERLSNIDQHQLRESYQEYHSAYARFMRAARNKEAFQQGSPSWMVTDEERRAWNLTYILGNDIQNLTATFDAAKDVMLNMENRIKAQLQQLEGSGSLPSNTQIDDLSPCIMRKIYTSQFPDQPAVSLLVRLRGDVPNRADWPPSELNTPEPPVGKGPEAVAAFIARAKKCNLVAPTELIVMLSGPSATLQATTWAWQSWQSDGFAVPILDTLDREAHAFNRLASVARGSLLVALRGDKPLVDDLLPGPDCSWLQHIITLYHRIPPLGAMAHGRFAFSYPGGTTRLLGAAHGNNLFFKEQMTSIPFQYVLYGDYMAMSFRRSALEEIGGFDEDLPQGSEPCGSYLRVDLCLRLWKSGWRVGAHDAGLLHQPVADVGPATNNDLTRCPPDVANLASQLIKTRHMQSGTSIGDDAPTLKVLAERVRDLNLQKLLPLGPDSLQNCPMEQGCVLKTQ
ncbi:hypothetical protein Vafri_17590 [Volvox africanus]|uniref:Uncharacterized protein n=1 Tax=Volvox africanus TaxID=51714 RepID=A0A8J4BL67_9CHLO|nr:hypothetical protein Vafri_17590 [Volvox africanus]